MNAKKLKQLRRYLREKHGQDEAQVYDVLGVASTRQHHAVIVTNEDGSKTRHADTAIQARLKAGSVRDMYQKVKQRVQSHRSR